MIRLNIHEAKTHLSRYLPALEAGETIVLCRRNVPIAEIRPIGRHRRARTIGTMRGHFAVDERFFEQLPEGVIAAFDGREPLSRRYARCWTPSRSSGRSRMTRDSVARSARSWPTRTTRCS